jgi:Na+-translocating ferredoxin:NAD+ oxidoreductase RnfD subunit
VNKIDGRWFLGGSHLTLVFVSIAFYNLQRSAFQIISAYTTALIVEFILYKMTEKNKQRTVRDVLFSSATIAAGLLILVKSTYSWFYIPMSAVAVSSKYFFTRTSTAHMFNPTNFAIVSMFALIPRQYFELRGDEFNISFYPMLHVFVFGCFAVYFGKTWRVTLSYFLSIFIISFLISVFNKESFIYLLGPEISAIGLIFMFLMITDPKTCPLLPRHQVLFGISVAVFLYVLRFSEFYYAHYVALFIVLMIRGCYLLMKSVSDRFIRRMG